MTDPKYIKWHLRNYCSSYRYFQTQRILRQHLETVTIGRVKYVAHRLTKRILMGQGELAGYEAMVLKQSVDQTDRQSVVSIHKESLLDVIEALLVLVERS